MTLKDLAVPSADGGAALESLAAARRAIAETEEPAALKGLRDYAESWRDFLKRRGEHLEIQNEAAEVKIRAERKLGAYLKAVPRAKPGPSGRDTLSDLTELQRALEEIGISRPTQAQWETEAGVGEEQFALWLLEVRSAGAEITSAGLAEFAKGGDLRSIFSSETAEWYTPGIYAAAARQLMGGIDLDPASCAAGNEFIRAAHYFTAEDDGLNLDWAGRVFLNPPYGKRDGVSNQGLWSRKLIDHYRAGDVDQAVLLVNAVPSEQWFRPLWDFPICFTDHRIQFVSSNGKESGGTHSNAFVYLGSNLADFIRLFSPFGVVAGRLGVEDA